MKRDIEQALRSLPLEAPSEGFEERVLANALPHLHRTPMRRHAGWALAAAACVTIAVLVTLNLAPTPGEPPERPVAVALPEVRTVDVMLRSNQALDGVTITVELDDNIALDGRPDVQKLSWQTGLKAGANKLSLPVMLLDARGGEILITLDHNGLHRELKVRIDESKEA